MIASRPLLLVLTLASCVIAGPGWIVGADGRLRANNKGTAKVNSDAKITSDINAKMRSEFKTDVRSEVEVIAPMNLNVVTRPIEVSLSNFGGNNRFYLECENTRLLSIDRISSLPTQRAISDISINMDLERICHSLAQITNHHNEDDYFDETLQ
jgi:hypothetical protein